MPVVPTIPALSSPPTNIFGLYQYLAQRIPGYDPSEYLREINSAYIHVWEEVCKLKNQYFTKTKLVTVAKAQFEYDLVNNADGGLSAPVSSRFYQVTRVRVLPPAGGLIQTSSAMHPNSVDFLAVAANLNAPPTGTGPYYYYMTGWGSIRFGLPLQVGSQIEFVYTYWPLALSFTSLGTIVCPNTNVTGTGTQFLSLAQPDFDLFLPTSGVVDPEQLQVELITVPSVAVNPGGLSQVYKVAGITSNTVLTLQLTTSIDAGSPYVLAAVPEIPREHIRVIASIAMGKMYDVAGDDARVAEWTGIAANNLQMMKDSLVERQGQNPPTKGRFPYGPARRNRAFLR